MPRKAAPAGTLSETRSLEGLCADPVELSLGADDLELIDHVLCVVPELRIVAFLGQEARRRGLAYPVSTAKDLVAILGGDSFELAGHRVDAGSIEDLPQEWFPLAHEGELLSVIYLGLHRCQAERTARPSTSSGSVGTTTRRTAGSGRPSRKVRRRAPRRSSRVSLHRGGFV